MLSAASLSRPGTFDADTMDSQHYGGLSLFAVLPGPKAPPQAFDELVLTARNLNERLRGVLQDEQGSPLTPARIALLRERLSRRSGLVTTAAAAAARAAELRAQLAQHDYRYYVLDDPLIPDADYDAADARAARARGRAPRADHPRLAHAARGRHPERRLRRGAYIRYRCCRSTMRSPRRTCRASIGASMNASGVSGELDYVAEPKLDGLAVTVIYRAGLARACRDARRRRDRRGRHRQRAHHPRRAAARCAARRRRSSRRAVRSSCGSRALSA